MNKLISLTNNFFCLIFVINLVNCQFNLNPVKKKNFYKNENLENKIYLSELQNHKITDQKVDDQVIQSNTIKVEENFSPTNNIRNFPSTINVPSTVDEPSTINQQSTINEPSTLNEEILPNTSQSLTSFPVNRLPQSSTPHTSQDVTVTTKNNNPILAYSPNNMAGSPSLISSIFAKMNQPVAGSFYPYNYDSYGKNSYPNQYYNNYLGYNNYPGTYQGSYPYYGYNNHYGGNTIANAFYSKMRPIVNFFQRLTGKTNYGYPTSYYGGAYNNGVYNNYNDYDTYRYGLYKGALLHKDSLLDKSETPSKLNHVLNSSASENQLSELNKFTTE